MREPIKNKASMYKLLAGGALGNTTMQYFSIEEWKASDEYERFETWGVRTQAAGGPCRLYCPRDEVEITASRADFCAAGINISVMVDAVVKVNLWADVFIALGGLTVYGIENPPRGGSWRALMPAQGKTHQGMMASGLLKKYLNAPSYSDLMELLEEYPDHVVELSACDRNIGIFPNRNTLIWEVRVAFGKHGGEYEKSSWKQHVPTKWQMRKRLDGD